MSAAAPPLAPRMPFTVWLSVYTRLLAIQGSWNYEILLGNGIGFCVEPVLRALPGGAGGPAYSAALARESRYFNAHPYLASVAVGALARAELEGEDPERIERFRTALAGPLGSVGDRLVWAAWLPFCSLLGLAAFGFGAGPLAALVFFLVPYNAGHLALRAWGLRVGFRHGLHVAGALGTPILRQGPPYVARAAALVAGIAIPLVLDRTIGPGRRLAGGAVAAMVLGTVLLVRLRGRVEGWQLALVALAGFVLFSVLR